MKRFFVIAALAAAVASCSSPEQKVMARYVPERADDFIWENDCIIYRAYGEKLEGETLSPGFDIWVKNTPELVANKWYEQELSGVKTYHHDAGEGKDCYKVAVSLGAGASAPIVDGLFHFPTTNYRDWEIVSENPTKVVFALIYPAWNVNGNSVSLRKEITVETGSNFCQVTDYYSGDFETLTIAAGITRHEKVSEDGNVSDAVEESLVTKDRFAFWEAASDQSVEPEDGKLGLGFIMPQTDSIVFNGPCGHALGYKTIKNGESLSYSFGCTWSKGNIQNWEDWANYVTNL